MSSEPAAPSDAGVSSALLAAAAAEAEASAAAVTAKWDVDLAAKLQFTLRFPLADGESPIGRLYKDAIQRVFSFLTPSELALTHAVSQLWRAAHDSERQARWLVTQILPRTIKRLQAELVSADESTQAHAVAEIRTLLSRPKDPPIQEVIATPGLLPRLIEILQSPVPKLQVTGEGDTAGCASCWALTNIASGTSQHCQAVLDAGIVPILVRMLSNTAKEYADATEQAVWCLGNIAGDSAKSRNFVLQNGALAPMLALVKPDAPQTLMRNTAWSISNLMRGKPQPDWNAVRIAAPTLKALLDFADDEVLTDSAWALSYLSDDSNGDHPRIQGVIQTGAVPRLVELLGSDNVNVLVPCLRTLGNLACGSDADTQAVLTAGFLSKLDRLLCHPKKSMRKESAWSLSSVLAGPPVQIQQVLDAQLMQRLIERLNSSETELDIKKECAWCVANSTSGGTPAQIRFVASLGGVTALCGMLDTPDPKIAMVALEGLRNFLAVGQQAVEDGAAAGDAPPNPYVVEMESCGGLDKVEALQQHANNEVYEMAVDILQTFFDSAEEDEDAAAERTHEELAR